eukprot:EG_transcript_46496
MHIFTDHTNTYRHDAILSVHRRHRTLHRHTHAPTNARVTSTASSPLLCGFQHSHPPQCHPRPHRYGTYVVQALVEASVPLQRKRIALILRSQMLLLVTG